MYLKANHWKKTLTYQTTKTCVLSGPQTQSILEAVWPYISIINHI